MDPQPLEPCPACGSGSVSPLHRRGYLGKQWTLARCRACTLHFTSPTPTEDDLAAFYAGDYHAELRTPGGAEAAFGAKYERYARTLARHLPSGRVLDVGCSTGLLVRMLRDRAYDAEGIELNPRSAAWGSEHYGVPIRTCPLEGCSFAPGSLDAVVLTDVLEHTRHPGRFLRAVGELLAPGGYALVTFPDIRSAESRYQRALARLLRRDWLWRTCHVPLHIWEFTRPTAEACFAGAGFRVVEFRRSQPDPDLSGPCLLRALATPSRVLAWPGIARRLGTQMEFVIQKTGRASENDGTPGHREGAIAVRQRSGAAAAHSLRPTQAEAA